MYVTILTPERTILSAEVDSLSVPGVNGEFQMLENHASVVSMLTKGKIKVKGLRDSSVNTDGFDKIENGISLSIEGGTLEFNENKAVVLVN